MGSKRESITFARGSERWQWGNRIACKPVFAFMELIEMPDFCQKRSLPSTYQNSLEHFNSKPGLHATMVFCLTSPGRRGGVRGSSEGRIFDRSPGQIHLVCPVKRRADTCDSSGWEGNFLVTGDFAGSNSRESLKGTRLISSSVTKR